MLAENDACRELAREMENMIKRGDARLDGKISRVMKETKNKSEYPKLLLHTGRILTDINEIYLYMLSDTRQRSRSSRDPYEGLSDNWRGAGGGFSMDEFMQNELEYDEDGNVVRSTDYDDEKVTYDKTKRQRFNDEDSEEEDSHGKIDINSIATKFSERRDAIRTSKFKNGKPVGRAGRRPGKRSPMRERSVSRERPKRKGKAKRREPSDDEASDYNDRYPDGNDELDSYYAAEARN
jgi:YD repeat-containing protein